MIEIIKESFMLQLKESLSRATFRFTLLLQPIFNCLLLYFILRGGSPLKIGEYLFINVSVMNLWSSIVYSSASDLNREKRMGTLGSNFAAPADFRLIYLGKVLANIGLSLFSFLITFLFIKYALNLSIKMPNIFILVFLIVIMLISFAVLSMMLGYVFLLYRNALTWLNLLEYPVYVLSGIAVPVSMMPIFLQPICDILPTRWMVVLLKEAFEKNYGLDQLLTSWPLAFLLILTLVYFLLLHYLNRVMETKIMAKGDLEVY